MNLENLIVPPFPANEKPPLEMALDFEHRAMLRRCSSGLSGCQGEMNCSARTSAA